MVLTHLDHLLLIIPCKSDFALQLSSSLTAFMKMSTATMSMSIDATTSFSSTDTPPMTEDDALCLPTIPDEDDYTLEAFGDISLTNAYFVPGLPSELSPLRGDAWYKKCRRTPPPLCPKLSSFLPEEVRYPECY